MYFNIQDAVLYLQIKLPGETQQNSSKMYKQKVQQKVKQKVQQKVRNSYVALLMKQFVFTKLVESFYY